MSSVVDKPQAQSLRRQRLRMILEELQRCAAVVQGRGPLVAGSLYERRRRCGKARCRCAAGRLHGSLALSISRQGHSRLVPLAGLDPSELRRCCATDRDVRQSRRKMQRLCRSLLQEAERLHRLRRVDPRRLRQRLVLPA